MTLYDELIARGLIAQVTNEEEIKNMINNGKATFYIGFDCTADSLHVGHFMALCLMKRLQMAGNKPIALIGDGTTLIGDPSGRTDMRQMLTEETIKHNAECFKRQMERFIDFSDGKALMLYNSEWLKPLNYIELLREVGACFSVNNMLRAECYKQRMEKGLSFLEFNYMIMQSYDFYYMFQHYGCNMQFGGDDQWSNMLGGTDYSCDIVRATEFVGLSEQEKSIIADTIKYNAWHYVPKLSELKAPLNRKNYIRMLKLAAILRLANGMDRSHRQKIRKVTTTFKEKELIIRADTIYDITLEQSTIENKSHFFEEIYGFKPVLRMKRR